MGGYGPGMMGGYGMGMMGGYGPGMMGGYGPGMMGGYGMGMMGGYGPGMMGGYGMGINLSDDQINKMQKIQSEFMKDMFSTMNTMWKARNEMWKAMRSQDKKAAGKAIDDMSSAMKEMFMQRMDIQEKMQNLLTKEQKERFNNAYRGMMNY
ncbi:Spy/CpxP family protein refolding chaperone, partial [Thiomicrorhabdus sp.]|uniref:Spy/CpxP family protein refolding chaperone n=1 Tax=Thiomicrorhabdus sp. TaxID=2039724 RepID=UPI003561A3E2